MRQMVLAGVIVLTVAYSSLNGQEILPLPTPSIQADKPKVEVAPVIDQVVVDQEIVIDQLPHVSTYQQQIDEQEETARERITRIAREKGDQRRARLAYQKAMGISNARPIVNPHAPMSNYTQTWYGGNSYVGPYNWIRQPAYHSWPYGDHYYGFRRY